MNETFMQLTTIDHIGAPTWDAAAAASFFLDAGVPIVHEEHIDQFNIDAVFLDFDGVFLEFLEPTGAGPTKTFLERHGPGFQHIAYRVPDIDEAIADLRTDGVRFQTNSPIDGVGGARVIFVEENHTAGFQTELVERSEESELVASKQE